MFWILCLLLISLSTLFFIPWLSTWRIRLAAVCFIICFTIGLYSITGGLQRQRHLALQQLDSAWETKRLELRHMLNAFKKQEFKLRQQISEHPEDNEAEYRLIDLMAIKALQQGKVDVAINLWQKVLTKMPIHKDTQNMRDRIENSLKNL